FATAGQAGSQQGFSWVLTRPHGPGMGYVGPAGPEPNDTDLPRSKQNANTPGGINSPLFVL
ncbi:MAG: hypothetical protein KDB01_23795, partial [Planctomycetaceae bacterium]|nr:hypothetical protein [Planctomycetaceae bacterium]